MIGVSTAWNADRHGGWVLAVRELAALGYPFVALGGASLQRDAAAAGRAAREARGRVLALFSPPPGRPRDASYVAGLGSPRAEVRSASLTAALASADAALAAGTRYVVLRVGSLPEVAAGDDGGGDDGGECPRGRDAGWMERLLRNGRDAGLRAEVQATLLADTDVRERYLEGVCRSLHALCKARPDVHWLLRTPTSTGGLPLPAECALVLDDLATERVGYWHDPASAARLAALGAVEQEAWLSLLGPRTVGVTLSDWTPLGDGMPPGSGSVAWKSLRGQVRDAMLRVLALDAAYPGTLFEDAVREVRGMGF